MNSNLGHLEGLYFYSRINMLVAITRQIIAGKDKEIKVSDEEKIAQDATSDDRLWAALDYVFTPVLPAVLLFVESKRDRPYIREHNAQALVWGIILYVVVGFTSVFFIGLCLWPLALLLNLYWGYRAYQGEAVKIPVISEFVRNQGWA